MELKVKGGGGAAAESRPNGFTVIVGGLTSGRDHRACWWVREGWGSGMDNLNLDVVGFLLGLVTRHFLFFFLPVFFFERGVPGETGAAYRR